MQMIKIRDRRYYNILNVRFLNYLMIELIILFKKANFSYKIL